MVQNVILVDYLYEVKIFVSYLDLKPSKLSFSAI